MIAYLIDPDRNTITKHAVQHEMLIRDLRKLIGADCMDQCKIYADRAGNLDQCWVSDTGLLEGLTRFSISTYGGPLAGKAAVIGCDQYGEAQDPALSLDELRKMVRFG